MEVLFGLIEKAGPYAIWVITGALVVIWWSIEGLRKAIEKLAEGQLSHAKAIDELTSAIKLTAQTTGEVARNQSDIIRMMERFQAAEQERHGSNVNTLSIILGMLQRGKYNE